MRTKSPHFDPNCINSNLCHAILGLVTESGELADVLKRAFFYGKGAESVDKNHIIEELGDLGYYWALACYTMGVTPEEVRSANIAKLRARYPNKFSTEDAYNRDTKKEMEALKGTK